MPLVTVEKLAQAMNLSPRRVQQLVDEGMPREERGRYELGQCMAWYIRYLQAILERREIPQVDAVAAALRGERQRLTRAQADREELELQKARAEVIPIAVFEERMAAMITQARQRLLMLPSRVAGELEGEPRLEIKQRLTRALYAVLNSLAGGKNGHKRRAPRSKPPDSGGGVSARAELVGTATDAAGDGVGGGEPGAPEGDLLAARPLGY